MKGDNVMRLFTFAARMDDTGIVKTLGVMQYHSFHEVLRVIDEMKVICPSSIKSAVMDVYLVRDAAHMKQLAKVFSKCMEGEKK